MKFAGCFGGATAVADETVVVVARHRSRRRQRRGMLPFRARFLSAAGKAEASPARMEVEDIYDMIARRTASVLSSSASLDSASSSSSSSSSSSYSCSSSRSSSSSSLSLLEATAPLPAEKRSAAAAVLLCLVMLLCCGRFAATLLTPLAFYLIPRRWPAAKPTKAESVAASEVAAAAASPVASWREEETVKTTVVRDYGFLVRNRHK